MNKKRIHITYILVFLGVLMLPNILMILGVDNYFLLKENRQLHKFSTIDLGNPIQAIKDAKLAYNDNFGFKNMSFSVYSKVKDKLFEESALPSKTIKGKEGWYFLGNSEGNVLNNSVGITSLSSKEWKIANSNIERLFNKMNDLDIPFYMVISRHKHEVYPEFLPFTIPNKQSKFDTLYNYWKQKYTPFVVDLKESTLKNKSKGQLYHKTDTHWNEHGAIYGFNTIISRLQPKFSELEKAKIEAYSIESKKVYQQDLTAMINKTELEDIVILNKRGEEFGKRIEDRTPGYSTARFINKAKKNKVIVFRDSFSLAMMKYYKEAFGECLFVKTRYPNQDIIKKENPDLVILQITSRRFETICKEVVY